MTFAELRLHCAIYQSRRYVKSRDYITQQTRIGMAIVIRDAYTRLIGDVHFPYTLDEVHKAYMVHRKSKFAKLVAECAIRHQQFQCFWLHRGLGNCCDTVHFGHVIPQSCGGPDSSANGMIECSHHNTSRGAMSIEDYLCKGVSV